MKRFYKEVSVHEAEQGWQVLLDEKPMHTPARRQLVAPTRAVAEAIASEWRMQGEQIDKASLRLTGYAALALDVVREQRHAVIAELLDYGDTDLLLYREDQEANLQRQQAENWDPWLRWALDRYGLHFRVASGIMPVEQNEDNILIYKGVLEDLGDWQLALLAVVTKATTSLILGLAFSRNEANAQKLLHLSRLEEDFNIAKWGADGEALAKQQAVRAELEAAETLRAAL